MKRTVFGLGLGLSLALSSLPVAALSVSLPLDLDQDGSISQSHYVCGDDKALQVAYINAGPNSLALIEIDGEDLIFAGVISASGARYAAGPYIWSTKGDDGALESAAMPDKAMTCTRHQG